MSAKQRRLLWPAIATLSITFMGLIWTSAKSKPVSLPAKHVLGTLVTASHSSGVSANESGSAVIPSRINEQDQSNPQAVQVERLIISKAGFNPQRITRPQGPFLLAIENRSGVEELDIHLMKVNGGKLREAKIAKKQQRRADLITLPPGEYKLIEANHPEWVCTITIEPH